MIKNVYKFKYRGSDNGKEIILDYLSRMIICFIINQSNYQTKLINNYKHLIIFYFRIESMMLFTTVTID